jgi:hypothetical protein
MWYTVHKPTSRVYHPGHESKEVAQSKMADVIKIYADDDPPKKPPLPGQPKVKDPKYPWLKKEDFALMELTGEEVRAMDMKRKESRSWTL